MASPAANTTNPDFAPPDASAWPPQEVRYVRDASLARGSDPAIPSEYTQDVWVSVRGPLPSPQPTSDDPTADDRSGKFLLFSNDHLPLSQCNNLTRHDLCWRRVAECAKDGRLPCMAAKASTRAGRLPSDGGSGVICVYAPDWRDPYGVCELGVALQRLLGGGGQVAISFKRDQETSEGNYSTGQNAAAAGVLFGGGGGFGGGGPAPPTSFYQYKNGALFKTTLRNGRTARLEPAVHEWEDREAWRFVPAPYGLREQAPAAAREGGGRRRRGAGGEDGGGAGGGAAAAAASGGGRKRRASPAAAAAAAAREEVEPPLAFGHGGEEEAALKGEEEEEGRKPEAGGGVFVAFGGVGQRLGGGGGGNGGGGSSRPGPERRRPSPPAQTKAKPPVEVVCLSDSD